VQLELCGKPPTYVVGKDLEGFADLLELLFGGRDVVLVSIRMPFQSLHSK
jgi:hypothetical protein